MSAAEKQTEGAEYFGVETRDTFDDAVALVAQIHRCGHVAKVRHGLIEVTHYNDWGACGREYVWAWIVEEWGAL